MRRHTGKSDCVFTEYTSEEGGWGSGVGLGRGLPFVVYSFVVFASF